MNQSTQSNTKIEEPVLRKLPLRRKLAYTAVCIVVVLLAGEAGLRLRAWIRYGSAAPNVPDDFLVYNQEYSLHIPRPGYEVSGAKIHIKVNSLGFRGDEFPREKPAHTVRIACLGASTTFCSEVSDDPFTWPARLHSLLQDQHPEVSIQVINAGIPGCVITDSLKNLRYRVLDLDPDLVIFYEANNDMAIDTRDLARKRGVIGENSGYLSGLSKFMSQHSLLYDLAYKNLTVVFSQRDTTAGKLSDLPSDLPDRFISELQAIHQMLAARQIPLVLSCFLTKYRRDQPRATQIANADVAFYYMPWMSIDSLLDGMDLYNNAIVKYAKVNQIPVIEDRVGVPADAARYTDFAHMTDASCEAMVQRFFRFFDDQRILDPVIAKVVSGQIEKRAPEIP
jgi:lysophospholipase L1-like esterase